MKLATFFEKFELFADTPNAVARMRESILRLAFSGGMSNNKTNGGGVPPGWETRTIESICSSLTPGFACSRNHQVEGGHVHLRTHNISTLGALNFDLLVRIDQKMVDPQKSSLRSGDILFNNTNSQELVGKSALVDRDYEYGFSNHITRLRLKEGVHPSFVVFYLTLLRNSGYFAKRSTRWINQAAINTDTLKVQLIPLPSLAEQKRIVAKVDELMALCDRLEAQQQERETRHAALARASLARFADAPTPANLDLLFHKSYSISPADLRKSILTLAVRGRLVPQDPNDGDEYAGPRYSQSELSKLTANLAVPPSWKLASLQDVAAHIADCPHSTPKWTATGKICVRTNQFSPGHLDLSASKYVSDATFEERIARIRPKADDILYSREGGILGVACRVPADVELCLGQRMMLIRSGSAVAPAFLEMVLNSPLIVDIARKQTTGGAAPRVNVATVKAYPIPLPPLTEQGRIVAKVDELMALVNALENQLATTRTAGAALLEAAIHELLNPIAEIIPFPSSKRESLPDRAAIGCYAIQRLADQRTFGRTAEVKVLYLAEAHLGLDLGGRYLRDAAGPLDQWIYKFEEDAARLRWFSVVEGQTKDGHKKIEYRAGPELSAKAQEASTRLSAAQRSEFDRLLGLLAQKPTVEVEAIATLFAAWNDFLLDGRQPSDDEIVREVRENWHPSKQRFKEPELKTWLAWLRQHALVPQGRGPHTAGQQGRLPLH